MIAPIDRKACGNELFDGLAQAIGSHADIRVGFGRLSGYTKALAHPGQSNAHTHPDSAFHLSASSTYLHSDGGRFCRHGDTKRHDPDHADAGHPRRDGTECHTGTIRHSQGCADCDANANSHDL
jgi:hypothetical protein